jgi:hypothetical protein
MSIDISSVDACIQRLRYVSADAEVLSSDLNAVTDCLKALSSVLRTATGGDPLVDELDAILSKIRYVRSGDVIEPDDHNLKVDAIKKARDILSKMESYYISQLNSLINLLNYILNVLQPWGNLVFGYGTTDWLGDLYTPTISFAQVSPFNTSYLVDVPTSGTSAYSELSIDYLTGLRVSISEGVYAG